MFSVLKAAAAMLLVAMLAGCELPSAAPPHPNQIIVRGFTYSLGTVTLDPSFGFSLYRGESGVPPRQRAAGVARAASFSIADTIATQLRAAGYDVVRSDTAQPEPGSRALLINGTLRQINEGYRRRVGAENAHVAADVAIDYEAAGAAPQRLMSFAVDSRQVPREMITGVAARRGADINAAAARIGGAVAGAVLSLARQNNWPSGSH